eukprot:365801-Chlamydomonas_euryale.AAC.6
MAAPRLLRPVKLEGGHYGQWGNYATAEGGADGRPMVRRCNYHGEVRRSSGGGGNSTALGKATAVRQQQ